MVLAKLTNIGNSYTSVDKAPQAKIKADQPLIDKAREAAVKAFNFDGEDLPMKGSKHTYYGTIPLSEE